MIAALKTGYVQQLVSQAAAEKRDAGPNPTPH